MPKLVSLAVATALMLPVTASVAPANDVSGFSAANAAMLRGYTASPGQIFLQTAPHGDTVVTGLVVPQHRSAPVRAR